MASGARSKNVKLGICVVYLIHDDNEFLLPLHFNQIEKCSKDIDYRIYAVPLRLNHERLQKLKDQKKIKILKVDPPEGASTAPEHSFLLRAAVENAIADGCTDIALLHLDSFPIQPDWFSFFENRMGDTFACIEYAQCAGLVFKADFYTRYRPSFLISEDEFNRADFKIYRKGMQIFNHSGIGFIYCAFQNQLSWTLLRIDENSLEVGQTFGDGRLFHLQRGTRIRPSDFKFHLPILQKTTDYTLASLYRVIGKLKMSRSLQQNFPQISKRLRIASHRRNLKYFSSTLEKVLSSS